jgi:hypothetical protein
MAKRSSINAIKLKQSGPYKATPRTAPAIHALGSIKSWPGGKVPSEAAKDAQAEKAMNPHGYSRRRNPLCPVCYVQRATNGSCGCSE